MTRSQLISKISQDTGYSAGQVETIMDAFVNNVINTLQKDDKVTISGFGRFEMRHRKTKNYTNPKTKVASKLAPTSIPGFKASGLMKDRIAGEK